MMTGYQGPKKQGDHVFAKDLPRLFDDLLERTATDLSGRVEGKTLTAAFTTCKDIVSRPVYQLTVDKGISSVDGDAHSVEYGGRSQAFRLSVINYITAVKNRYRPMPALGAPPDDRERFMVAVVHDDRFVCEAVDQVTLAVSEWARAALDAEAAALVPARRADIAAGAEGLKQVMSLVLAAVRRH